MCVCVCVRVCVMESRSHFDGPSHVCLKEASSAVFSLTINMIRYRLRDYVSFSVCSVQLLRWSGLQGHGEVLQGSRPVRSLGML